MQPTIIDLHNDGWSLIPVSSTKRPIIPSWTPYQLERADLDQIERWSREPKAAIWAGVTGQVSGRFTIDFDGEPGRATLEKLGCEPHRSTPGGGYHVDFFIGELDVRTLNSKSKVALGEAFPCLDTRGEGGYINLLGSNGTNSYQWLKDDRTPYDPSTIPDKLMELIVKGSPTPKPRKAPVSRLEAATQISLDDDAIAYLMKEALERSEFGRNDSGFWLACHLRDAGLPEDKAEEVMRIYCNLTPETDPAGEVTPYGLGEALSSLRSAYSGEYFPTDNRPEIEVKGRQLSDISNESLDILVTSNAPPTIFRRGGEAVTVVTDQDGRVRINSVNTDRLRHHMSQVARWVHIITTVEDGEEVEIKVNKFPPLEVIRDLLARDWDAMPGLDGVVEIPILRPDGTMLAANGYDRETRLWMDLPEDLEIPPVPERPSHDDVRIAREVLEESLTEFCFSDEASMVNAVGLILSTVLRSSVPGLIPMAVVDAPVAGSGKTILVNLASIIAHGRPAPMSAAPNGNDEELRKRITAALMTGEAMMVFDNVDRQLRSPILAQALTAPVWSDRVLGVSKNVELKQHSMWAATGNNVEIGGDLPRRCYLIRLDPKMAQPAQREFERTDLLGWAGERRGSLLWACFTLARHWFVLGSPKPKGTPWAGFEGFAQFIGGILESGGFKGFLGNLAEVQQVSDPDAVAWTALLGYWHLLFDGRAVQTKDLLVAYDRYKDDSEVPRRLSESLDRASGAASRVTRLSRAIGEAKGRYYGDEGFRIELVGRDGHSKTNLWRIECDMAPVVGEVA